MFQNSLVAKPVAAISLLAASFLSPYSWQPSARTCTGPNCPLQQRQCSHPATVVLNSIPVTTAPQLFRSDLLGDQWVLVEEPIHEGEPEDLVSPAAETEEVKAEVEADATEEQAEGKNSATEDDAKAKADSSTGNAAKAKTAAATRKVWMRAADAKAAGLATLSTTNRSGFGSNGSAVAMAPTVEYRTVTYQQSCGCTGNAYGAFYGQPVYQQAAPAYYRTRRILFPNLFPRLRGLR